MQHNIVTSLRAINHLVVALLPVILKGKNTAEANYSK